MRGRDTPVTEENSENVSSSQVGVDFDLPKRTRNWWVSSEILRWPPCQGMSVSARTASQPPTKGGEETKVFIDPMQRQ